ncbi:relaxase/mobilization nuclease domain-containing protein [Pseudonocardia sp.]|uniref:relaxase/mobilization nuclease domain-containing protein n=1 Tax=Pseudonocardia sp. TaxID=60912 RepID=UPI003D0C140C
MITKVVRGWRVGGLITYLMGPGRAQEHVQPRVVASWDGRDAAWQPPQVGEGEFDRDLGPLIRALRAPAVAAGLPEHGDEGKRGYVWHCSARVAAADRVLSDAEWAEVARDLLDGAGVAARGDAGGPRWVAIRHADDHIHIAVVLVRQDTGRRIWPAHDYPRLREAARGVERRLGLTVTAPADGTAAKAPQRGELEKARRQGRLPARVELTRAVRAAAVGAENLVGFLAALRADGYLVEVRRGPSGDPLGYKIARPGDVSASGEPVFYSGSKLAPDLSLPRLLRSWESAARGTEAAAPLQAARRRVDAARALVGSVRHGGAERDAQGIAQATLPVLSAVGLWSDELRAAAETFDRAARSPRGVASREGARAAGLRRVARQLVRQRRMLDVRDEPGAAAVALVVALSALVREIAAWQQDTSRPHQAVAASAAADALDRWAAHRAIPSARDADLVDHGFTARRPRLEPRPDRGARRPSISPRG